MEVKCSFKPGSVIGGKFEIVKRTGEGSLGDDVYMGRQRDLKRDVTIRILPSDVSRDKEMVQRFVQEIQISATLQHPNILPAYEAGEHAGRAYLVTAVEDGEYLRETLRRQGAMGVSEAMKIGAAISEALEYAWTKGRVLHRNLRPESIIIAKGGQPLLADFGMAKFAGSGGDELTMAGYTIGNPDYMSPEQVRGESGLDCRSDIYCLGLVLYECLAGQQPFKSASPVALMEMQMSQPHKPLTQVSDAIDPACSSVIDRMLEKDKARRYQGYASLIADFNAVLGGGVPSAMAGAALSKPAPELAPAAKKPLPPPAKATTKPKSGKAVTFISIAAAIAVIIALAVLASVVTSRERAKREGILKTMYEKYVGDLKDKKLSPGEIDLAISNFEMLKASSSDTEYEAKAEAEIQKLQALKAKR